MILNNYAGALLGVEVVGERLSVQSLLAAIVVLTGVAATITTARRS